MPHRKTNSILSLSNVVPKHLGNTAFFQKKIKRIFQLLPVVSDKHLLSRQRPDSMQRVALTQSNNQPLIAYTATSNESIQALLGAVTSSLTKACRGQGRPRATGGAA